MIVALDDSLSVGVGGSDSVAVPYVCVSDGDTLCDTDLLGLSLSE